MRNSRGRNSRNLAVFVGLAAVIVATLATAAHGSILVHPHALFTDDTNPSCMFTVQNTGLLPVEVAIEVFFGYPASDSSGNVYLKTFETPPDGAPSAASWIRALPRRIFLGPKERQVVRILARPPENLPPGEYWARVAVGSVPAPGPQPPAPPGQIRVGLNLATRVVISYCHRRTPVETALDVQWLSASARNGELEVKLRMHRRGNAAFLGTVSVELSDREGKLHRLWDRVVAVYYDLDRVYAFDVSDVPPGHYRLRVSVTTDRSDLPPEVVLPASPYNEVREIAVR